MTEKAPKTFVFYIVPDFTMLAFTSAIEALRLANAVRGEEFYRWRIVSANGEPVRASCGLVITPDGSVADEKAKPRGEQPNVVAVCAGWHVEKSTNKSVAAWLRWSRNAGASVAGICTGAYLLAEAGLLAEKRCTIHWENLPSFSERFSDLIVSSNLIEYDGSIFTCAGGTASFDLMLHMIENDLGRKTALAVCDQAIVDRVRSPSEKQRRLVRTLEKLHPVLLDAVEYMESNMADHVSMDEVARHIRLSRRQLERMFAAELGSSPSRFFLELRLDHARLMVLQSGMAIVDVAVACGFVSASHFTRCFRMQYGVSPQRMREEAPRSAHLPSLSAPTAGRSAHRQLASACSVV